MYRKAISLTAALAFAAGLLCVAGDGFARGAGGFAGRGPVFGFHPRAAGHRPFRPALAHHATPRFGWQLRWWNRRNGAAVDGTYPGYGSGAPYPYDVTGGVPGPTGFYPPVVPPAPPERIGCYARGYDVPGESGGVAHVTVIRC